MREKRHSRDLVRFHRSRKIEVRTRQLNEVGWTITHKGKLSKHHPRQWCSCYLCTKCFKSAFETKCSETRKAVFYIENDTHKMQYHSNKRVIAS